MFPIFKKIFYDNAQERLILGCDLKANKDYQFVLSGKSFKSPEGISIADYVVKFKTR